jgi:hypothetical protein
MSKIRPPKPCASSRRPLDAANKCGTTRTRDHSEATTEITRVCSKAPSWKRFATPLALAGLSLSNEVLNDRRVI